MCVFFLLREHSAKDGRNAKCRKDACGEAGAANLFRSRPAGNLVGSVDVAAERRKGTRRTRVRGNLASGDGFVRGISYVIAQQDQAVRFAKRQRTQQNPFDEREHRGDSADAQRQRECNRQAETRRFHQLSKCEAEILYERIHGPPSRPFSFVRNYQAGILD